MTKARMQVGVRRRFLLLYWSVIMTLGPIISADRVKASWVKPVVRSVSAGSAEAGGALVGDGPGVQTS